MSTTPAARSTSSPARRTCAIARRSADEIGEIPEGLYPGDYLVPVGEALAAEFGDALCRRAREPTGWRPSARRTVAAMIELIKADLALLGVHHDLFASEAEVQESRRGRPRAARLLDAKGLVYHGHPGAAQGQDASRIGSRSSCRCSARRSSATTRTGRSRSRTAAGPISAPTPPITCRRLEKADELINVWGADHAGTVKRTQAAVEALTEAGPRSTSSWCRWSGCCATASWSRCRSARATSSPSPRWSRKSARTSSASPC